MNENAPKILDQDDFVLHPMVWTGSGEIVGNHVTVTIRAYDGVYKCFARVERAMGHNTAVAGLAISLDDANASVVQAVCKMLEADGENK